MLSLPRKRAPHFSESFSPEEKQLTGTVWATDTSHLTVVIHRCYRYLQHFCCATSHAHLIYPMGNLSAESFVEAVTYICDHVNQRFGTKILQFQGDCVSSFVGGGVMMKLQKGESDSKARGHEQHGFIPEESGRDIGAACCRLFARLQQQPARRREKPTPSPASTNRMELHEKQNGAAAFAIPDESGRDSGVACCRLPDKVKQQSARRRGNTDSNHCEHG